MYPKPFPVSSKITEEEVLGILRRLPLNRALESDTIGNTFLKAYRYTLAPILARLLTVCLQRQYYLNYLKYSITIAIRKLQKLENINAGLYRLKALLNILAKALEAVVAKRILKEAEQRKLLLES